MANVDPSLSDDLIDELEIKRAFRDAVTAALSDGVSTVVVIFTAAHMSNPVQRQEIDKQMGALREKTRCAVSLVPDVLGGATVRIREQ